MSQQQRPQQTLMTICDLCDEPISTQSPYKKASLVTTYSGPQARAKATAWSLIWSPRNWPGLGGSSWDEQQRDKERWRDRHYDFHTECLLKTVEKAIAERAEVTR